MKRILFFALLLNIFLSANAFSAEHKNLENAAKVYVNGFDANYPPFSFLDKKGEPTGFDIESMNWIAKKMGFTVEHRPMDWAGIVPSLLARKIDMICSGMSMSPERVARVNFSAPYWETRKLLVVPTKSSLTKESLLTEGKSLGVQAGTNEAEFLKEAKETNKWNYSLKYYASPQLALTDLAHGRIDGAAVDSGPASLVLEKADSPVKVIGEFAPADQFGVAVRKEDTALLKIINDGYDLLKKDPYWQELQKKYFPY